MYSTLRPVEGSCAIFRSAPEMEMARCTEALVSGATASFACTGPALLAPGSPADPGERPREIMRCSASKPSGGRACVGDRGAGPCALARVSEELFPDLLTAIRIATSPAS